MCKQPNLFPLALLRYLPYINVEARYAHSVCLQQTIIISSLKSLFPSLSLCYNFCHQSRIHAVPIWNGKVKFSLKIIHFLKNNLKNYCNMLNYQCTRTSVESMLNAPFPYKYFNAILPLSPSSLYQSPIILRVYVCVNITGSENGCFNLLQNGMLFSAVYVIT